MLTVLKVPDWQKIPPLAFYFHPLLDTVMGTRKHMLKMHEDGILRVKYIIEDNTELMDKTIAMVQQDNITQWLAGDDLKRDQFKFLYNTMKIIYDSALKDLLIAEDPKVLDVVLPMMVAFNAIKLVRKMFDSAEKVTKNTIFKMERSGSTLSLSQTQELKSSLSTSGLMDRYGRMWVWEGYYDPDRTI